MVEVRSQLEPALCALMPHAPILLPAVAGAEIGKCRRSSEACVEVARRLVASRPDRVVLISPHAPRVEGAFGAHAGPRLAGGFAGFGAPGESVDLPNDREAVRRVAQAARGRSLPVMPIPRSPLDHGATVPLWFLVRAGWHGMTSVFALPWSATPEQHTAFGRVLAEALAGLGGRTALIASGDMTHRALPGAPAGHDPRGVVFDETMRDHLAAGELDRVPAIDQDLRRAAAEDSVETTTIVAAALGFEPHGVEVMSYEHPFGVGYLVAVLHDGARS